MAVIHQLIAGFGYRIRAEDVPEEFSLPRFRPFTVRSGRADVEIGLGDPSSGHRSGGSDAVPAGYDGNDPETVTAGGTGSVICLDFRRRRLDVLWRGTEPAGRGLFRTGAMPYSVFLHEMGATILHSSCVDTGGRAALFLAPDEGGKTTAAGSLEGCTVLADDGVLVRREGRRFRAWGTPWTTFEPVVGSSLVCGLFLLRKSDRSRATPAGFCDVFSHLWGEQEHVRRLMPPFHRRILFDLLSDLASSAPSYFLEFPARGVDRDLVTGLLAP